jgi:hypothetical protein
MAARRSIFVIVVLILLRFTVGGRELFNLVDVNVVVSMGVLASQLLVLPLLSSANTMGTHSFFTATLASCAPSVSITPAIMTIESDMSRYHVDAVVDESSLFLSSSILDDRNVHRSNANTDARQPMACMDVPMSMIIIRSH